MKNTRRHQRIPYAGPIRVSWTDASGEPKFAFGKCIEVSESGLRVEVPVSIPERATVQLNAERIKFAGSSTVKRVEQRGTRYVLGLELSASMTEKAIAVLREPWELRKETPVR